MASKVEAPPRDCASVPSLPVLREGRSSLVSSSASSKVLTPREKASDWALNVRQKIDECIKENVEVKDEYIYRLKVELIAAFITALQHDTNPSWNLLHEIILLVEPYGLYLKQYDIKAELYHYLERIVYHFEGNREKLFDIQMVDALSVVFPDEICNIKQRGAHPARNYSVSVQTAPTPSVKQPTQSITVQATPSPPPSKSPVQSITPRKSKLSPRMTLPDGSNPYSMHIKKTGVSGRQSKPLTFGDLSKSMGNVAIEMAQHESIWSHCLGTTALALNVEIPEEDSSESLTRRSSESSCTEFILGEDRKEKRPDVIESIKEEVVPEMTGREAVEHFAKCHHSGKIKALHFNTAPNRHFRPYDLICVPKNKANPEHYVFNTFGVLHKYPNQPSESLSLAEWQRHAVLWNAVSSIPFFKNYLIRKMFDRWRSNVMNVHFLKKRDELSSNLLQAVPAFGTALLQISRLLKELITIHFLPFEMDKSYSLAAFEDNINYKNIQADKLLEKFFNYCKMVVDVTAEESFKKLKYCEDQLRKKSVFSKDSLHLQKVKKQQREENLRKAINETGRLGNFVKLVDQLIVEHMFHITKVQVMTFISDVLDVGFLASRDGFFKANLIFTKQDVLGITPSKDKFNKVLSGTLKGIPSVLCANALPMDGSAFDHDMDDASSTMTKSGDKKTKSVASHSDKRSLGITSTPSKRQLTDVSSKIDLEGLEQTDSVSSTGRSSEKLGENDELRTPDITRQATPSKSQDEFGVATPNLVLEADDQNLCVEGEGFMGQYVPLSRAGLEEKLDKDADFQKALQTHIQLMNVSMEEIDQYCDYNKWLNEIHAFCKSWTDKSVKEYKGVAAFTIEQKLTEVRQWSEKVRNFDRFFITENGLFYVDCSAVHDWLVPKLNDIYQELVTFVSDEVKNLATNFCQEMKTMLENMKDKRANVEVFAKFAKNFSHYKKNTPHFQQRVEYIKSLYEVIRMSYRQLTPEEEKTEENVWAAWEAFLLQMQDASEFVNTQTPLMTQQLENTFHKLEAEAHRLSELATSGKFLDPDQNPTQNLRELKEIREKFYSVQDQLHQASRWRESICGEPYDLKFLNDMTVKMDVRQELWKYVEVSSHAIKDWKQMLFKKINIKKALEKVLEWTSAAGQLKPFLPPGDEVLKAWFNQLQDFKKDLPILHKLNNDALKERHWKAIFVGMNESYDPNHQFTVSELLSYDLDGNSDLINTIYQSAINEYDLEQKILKLHKTWEEREFKLAKHIPDSVINVKEPQKVTTPRRRTKLEKFRAEKVVTPQPQGLDIANDDFFILIEVDELKYQLEDTRITLHNMLQSPYLGDMKHEVEFWENALHQIEEITGLWYTCQKKWLYLLKVFEKPELYRKLHGLAFKFENVNNKFKDWMRVVSNDAKVLTVVNKRRGEKGYRLLQGDNLRSLFLRLTEKQEEILKHLNSHLEISKIEFPRLFFISDLELVEMLGISRNPQLLCPFAKKVFPGLESLVYSLPAGFTSMNSALDFALHADKLQVVSIQGQMQEIIPLLSKIDAVPEATKWLKTLENVMKNTMMTVLEACVQARLEEGGKQPIHLLEELAKVSQIKSTSEQKDIAEEIKYTFRHWLLRFPVQTVLIAECILFERSVHRILEKCERDDLLFLRSNLNAKIDQYIELLKGGNNEKQLPKETFQRLRCLISSLIHQSAHHRDVIDALSSNTVISYNSFDWLKTVRYHMDIRSVLRAKTEITESSEAPDGIGLKMSSLKSPVDLLNPSPNLTRTKTTVSTGYQFSPCYIQQLGNNFAYDYEYSGPSQRLVMTPLTERAFLSLTQALKLFQTGTLVGPPDTGKSETLRELAQKFGRHMITFNMNEDMTLPKMMQYMTGMVQSGSWVVFDNAERLTTGLMSVAAQHFEYLRTALRTLEMSSGNQYKIRGQPRFDKKPGAADKVIRRNSLTTLHPLPSQECPPALERQKTVPHGFNEKGLVTYFEEPWVAEKEQRRHSIEREIEIKESELYRSNKPPPLFCEQMRLNKKKSPDYSKLMHENKYVHRILGNVMFNGKLIQASANYGCFMTMNSCSAPSMEIPENFRLLMRPCALIVPDTQLIVEMTLYCHCFTEYKRLAKKLTAFIGALQMQLPNKERYSLGIGVLKKILHIAAGNLSNPFFKLELQHPSATSLPDVNAPSPSHILPDDLPTMEDHVLEEHSLTHAIREVFLPTIEDKTDTATFQNCLRDYFPKSGETENMYGLLNRKMIIGIKNQLKEDNLKETPALMEKIIQLMKSLESKQGVILTGAAGSGKSVCYNTLARAINTLNYKLFAPDHSKDELKSDRGILFHTKQKLKFLGNIDPPKEGATQGGKRVRRLAKMVGIAKETVKEFETALTKPKEVADYPKINLIHLFPTSMSPKELLGYFDKGIWHGGLLPKVLDDCGFMYDSVRSYINTFKEKKTKGLETPSVLKQWIVLDGFLHPSWMEGLNTLLDDERKLSLADGERIPVKDNTSLIFETSCLKNVSPASIARCSIIHCDSHTADWQSLYEMWSKTARTVWVLTHRSLKVLEDLVTDVFGPTVKFITSQCTTSLLHDVGEETARANQTAAGIYEVSTFLKILSILLDKYFLREDFEKRVKHSDFDELGEISKTPSSQAPSRQATSRMTSSSLIENIIPNYIDLVKSVFVFSYVWSFGGSLHDRSKEKFSKFAKEILYRSRHPCRIPQAGTVFDYYIDDSTGGFTKWSDRHHDRARALAGGFVITSEVEKYSYLIEILISAKHPVLLTGAPGVGKSSLAQHMVLPKQTSSSIMMSPKMTVALFQENMMSHILELKQKRFNVMNAPRSSAKSQQSTHHLFFIDDINTAHHESDYQPPLELMRQILTMKGTYDRQRQQFQDMSEALFLAACTSPTAPGTGLGHACHILSPRLTRQFVNLSVFSPTTETSITIFSRGLQNWLEEFPTYSVEHHHEFSKAMTLGLVDLYQLVKDKFKSTPMHPHYVYSLHDVAKVVQGIMLMSPRSTRTRKGKVSKKSKDESKKDTALTLIESKGRTTSTDGQGIFEMNPSAPMMKIIAQLWCHECCRTFSDRLISDDDRMWFNKMLEDTAVKYFCSAREDVRPEMSAIFEEGRYGDKITTPIPEKDSPFTPSTPSDFDAEVPLYEDSTALLPEEMDKSFQQQLTKRSSSTPSESKKILEESSDSRDQSPSHGRSSSGLKWSKKNTTFQPSQYGAEKIDEGSPRDMRNEDATSARPATETGTTDLESSEIESTEEESSTNDESSDEETNITVSVTDPKTAVGTKEPDISRPSSFNDNTKCTPRSAPNSTLPAPAHDNKHSQECDAEICSEKMSSNMSTAQGSIGSIGGKPTMKRQGSKVSLGSKRGVTFKAGLLSDKEMETYYGPLMSLEEIKSGQEDLSNFIFSKAILATHAELYGTTSEKGYIDCTKKSLVEALRSCLSVYNKGTSQKLELVFFTEAAQHVARLSRVMAVPGGHALLLGISYSTGRATLTRLAAYIAHNKVFEPKSQAESFHNYGVVKEHIKRCCQYAGIQGKAATLLIHEELGSECLQDICSLMAEGTCPGLYTENQIQNIVSQMMPGGVQTKRVDKIEQAFERYIRRIRQNIHVVISLNYKGNSFSSDCRSLHEKMVKFPGLLKYCCSIDVYKPWSYDDYRTVARVWLVDEKSKIQIPWSEQRTEEQLNLTCQAMAYMHMSAKSAIERQFCHQKEPLRFYSPLTYMEFVHLFKVVCSHVVKKERDKALKYALALGKIDEAFNSINSYKNNVSDLLPQHRSALDKIQELVERVEQQKKEYIEALDRCKAQEEEIMQLQAPLDNLKKESQLNFDKVNPSYIAALQAFQCLQKGDIVEVKSFRAPPKGVILVINALCLMFRKPQDWENGKLLLIQENFMNDIIFYDKDNMPDDIFDGLKEYIDNPEFDPNYVKAKSSAAACICFWVRSAYKYAEMHRGMQPHLRSLQDAEEKFNKAQAKLGLLRIEANKIKANLESRIQAHREAVKQSKGIEKVMQGIEKKISGASNLMTNMSMQHFLWRSELKKARRKMRSAPGDALLTVACVCYHGPLNDKTRAEVLHDWLDRCRQGNFSPESLLRQPPYTVSAKLQTLMDGVSGGRKISVDKDTLSEVSGSLAPSESNISGDVSTEVHVYKYHPVLYDTSKYYISELKMQDSMETIPNMEEEDSDDEEEQSPLFNRPSFSLQDILSDFDELSDWRMKDLPTDLHSVQNALLMRVSCYNRKHCWPLLIDPDNQAEMWVKTLQNSKNIFTEKDIQIDDFDDEDEGIPVPPTEPESPNLLDPPPPPPSRGTALTFSDVTECTLLDESGLTSTETKVQTSRMLASRNSSDSEDLRPVTSVTNSWETYSLHAENSLDHPDNNLWIMEADDPQLDSRLINAVVHGVTVLITHLERKPLDPLFRGLLLKQFYVDKEGNKVVKVGSYEFDYHPNFCLYLSTSVPLFLQGDGLFSLPINRLCVINMAVSDEYLINRLLFETMNVERKEFEGQKRSNEIDIILHRQRLAKEHDIIREKTLNLDIPLLDDNTMLDSLIQCQNNVEKNKQILEETRYMGDHLEEKFAHYVPMVTKAAILFNLIKKISILQPFYYMPFYKYVDMYSSVIKSRDRGKGSIGAPQARAEELSYATTQAVLRYTSLMMFEHHHILLMLLYCMERMRLARKASSKELSLFINGYEKQGLIDQSMFEQKPSWISNYTWIETSLLENVHHSFHGLAYMIANNDAQWEEYFKNPVILMNPVPGTSHQELSIFQKCILWKIAAPARYSEVCNSIILYELGSIAVWPDHYNIKDVYNYSDQYTPVTFIMPGQANGYQTDASTGYPYITPLHEVKRLAKDVGMEGKVRITNLGLPCQMCEIRQVLEDCVRSGLWLVVQNYQLADNPEQEYFDLLKAIVYCKWGDEDQQQRENTTTSEEGSILVTRSRPSTHGHEQLKVHPNFRLWLTTQTDGNRLMPGLLIQHGLKVTCETTNNFKSTLFKSYKSAAFMLNNMDSENLETRVRRNIVMPIALLHSLLLQQRYYGNAAFSRVYHWTLTDLAMAADTIRKMLWKYNGSSGIVDLVSHIYTDHCINEVDATVVDGLTRFLTEYATGLKELKNNEYDVADLLKKLITASDDPGPIKRAIDSLEEHSATSYGLPESADVSLMANHSRIMSRDVVQASGAPELLLRMSKRSNLPIVNVDTILPQVLASLQQCPQLPQTSKEHVYPFDKFLDSEIEGFQTLLETLQSDLALIQRHIKGETSLPPDLEETLLSVCMDQVPKYWLSQTFPSCSSLTEWMKQLPIKIKTVISYLEEKGQIGSYNMASFLRPDRFVKAVALQHARKQFKDISSIDLDIQIMPAGITPSMPPAYGVYLMGLYIHNAFWDSSSSMLLTNIIEEKQLLPVVWLKPIDKDMRNSPSRNYNIYSCPVFSSCEPSLNNDCTVVMKLPLPVIGDVTLWSRRRVFISPQL